MIVDGDGHLFEPATMWRDYSPAADRERALSIDTDELGYPLMCVDGKWVGGIAQVSTPGEFGEAGRVRNAQRAGLPYPGVPYAEMPEAYWNPSARKARLPGWGIDKCVLYPQSGFVWEYLLEDDLAALRVNMAAWNRWAVEVAQEGGGALAPTGHISFQGDQEWVIEQLRVLAAGGVRMAMCVPRQINGKRLSHPDNDPIWKAMVDLRIAPAWHINFGMAAFLDNYRGWCDNDTDSFLKVVPGIFQGTAAQIALVDLAVNGVFERFPDFNVVLAEVGSAWLPPLLRRLDHLYATSEAVNGRPLCPDLRMAPSEYVKRNAIITCSFPADTADPSVLALAPDNFAFGGDYPHPEGLAQPLADYKAMVEFIDPATEDRFYGDNLARLL
jgi:predicted TIM-barrel fold metal-dependent hydrolase